MFKHQHIVQQLESSTSTILERYAQEYGIAEKIWDHILNDERLIKTIMMHNASVSLPSWREKLGFFEVSKRYIQPYRVFAVDGSQIYPDRHQGLPVYVINIGIADFYYNKSQSKVTLEAIPYLFYTDHDGELQNNPEIINNKRSELELQQGLVLCQQERLPAVPCLFLCDGSLIAWHLTDNTSEYKKQSLDNYIQLFEQFQDTKALIAGYISLPKSRDLVAMVRELYNARERQNNRFNYLVDTDLLQHGLLPYHRTTIFESHRAKSDQYPHAIRTHFFYLNVGCEIARIEIPAWIANDVEKIALVEQMVLDQACKGQGYPICLAEAHEQAVIKAADRDMFYQTMRTLLHKKGIVYPVSQKSIKKRSISI